MLQFGGQTQRLYIQGRRMRAKSRAAAELPSFGGGFRRTLRTPAVDNARRGPQNSEALRDERPGERHAIGPPAPLRPARSLSSARAKRTARSHTWHNGQPACALDVEQPSERSRWVDPPDTMAPRHAVLCGSPFPAQSHTIPRMGGSQLVPAPKLWDPKLIESPTRNEPNPARTRLSSPRPWLGRSQSALHPG